MSYKTFGTFLICVLLVNALLIFTGSTKITKSETINNHMPMHVVKYQADIEKTVITWSGRKIGKEHTGIINLKSGYVLNDHGNINKGKFIIDMTSLKNTDIEDEGMKAKLEGHLRSEDFFNTNEFAEAIFELKSIKPLEGIEGMTNTITADLTIKGITHSVEVPANISWENNSMFVHSEFEIDRTKWNVHYGSKTIFDSLGDKFIYDDIKISVRTQLNSMH